MKYNPDGDCVWARRHNSSGSRYDDGTAIAVSGNRVFVTGLTYRSRHRYDVSLLCYAVSGTKKWVRYYDDSLHWNEEPLAITATGGAVFICGAGRFTRTRPPDGMLLKYDHYGQRRWVRFTAGSGGGEDVWTHLAADGAGRIHVTGYVTRKSTRADILARLCGPDGSYVWQNVYGTGGVDVGSALAIDTDGSTYVCGWGGTSDVDAVVIKYAADGTPLWNSVYPDHTNYTGEADAGVDWANDVAVEGEILFAVGGHSVDHGGTADTDFLTWAIWR